MSARRPATFKFGVAHLDLVLSLDGAIHLLMLEYEDQRTRNKLWNAKDAQA